MKIVVMSAMSPKDLGVLTTLHHCWPIAQVIQPDWNRTTASPQAKWKKLRRSPWAAVVSRLQRPFYDWHARRLDQQVIAGCFGTAAIPSLDVPRELVPVREVNSDATAAGLRRLEPDVMITSTCPLLKPNVFTIPRLGTLNVHWGIAQHYRGDHTVFWPLYFGDFANIGVTIHQIDDGIDTGPVLAQGFVKLEPGDTEGALYAKCARLASELLDAVFRQLEAAGAVPSLPVRQAGRLFRERDRTAWHDAVYAVRRQLRRRVIPARPGRVVLAGDALTSEPREEVCV